MAQSAITQLAGGSGQQEEDTRHRRMTQGHGETETRREESRGKKKENSDSLWERLSSRDPEI